MLDGRLGGRRMRLIAVDLYGEAGGRGGVAFGRLHAGARALARKDGTPQRALPGGESGRGVDISLPVSAAGWLTVLPSLTGETP